MAAGGLALMIADYFFWHIKEPFKHQVTEVK